MLRWLKRVALRAKTIAVVEQEYQYKLQVAGGRDTLRFNAATRLAADRGGNEFDAANFFMAAEVVARFEAGENASALMSKLVKTTARLNSRMRRPDLAEATMEDVMRSW